MTKKWVALGLLAALASACGVSTEQDFEAGGELSQELANIPGRVEAEAYDRFSEKTPASNSGGQCDRADGVDKELTSDPTGGTCNVGWTDAGEYLEYDLTVASEALFGLSLRLAADTAGRTVHAELDGANLGTLNAPSTGWQGWADRAYTNVRMKAGKHVLRVVFDTGLVNFNYVNITQNAASCTDGIKNGSETGIDCGGSCTACASSCLSQALTPVVAVSSANETAAFPASLAIDNNTTTRWSSPFSDPQWLYVDLGAARKINRVVLNWEAAYSKGYDVQVSSDLSTWTNLYSTSTGDGAIDDLTGLNGTGRYVRMYSRTRATQWGTSLFEIGVFGDPNPNCNTMPPPASCTDGIKNGTETGVDCGGSCPACAPTCTDGVKNGTETGVDCGGSCPACAPTCTDGVKNGTETGVDCGGSCPACAPTCTDGVKNGTETGVDCGGSCPACAPTCMDGIKNGTETGIDCGGSCPVCNSSACVEQALNRVAATASSVEDATFPASLAIDASATTRWSSLFADPQWIYIDLGARRHVSRVRLSWEAAASRDYDVQISDNTAGPWTNLYSTAAVAGDGGLDDLGNLNGNGRYVRMYSRSRTTVYGVSLFDFAVLGDNNPLCTPNTNNVDSDGDRLPDSVETGTGQYVSPTNTGTSPTNADTDADGLPDGDEVLGTTAGLNLPAMGVSPVKKNILLEYDWFDDALDCGQHSHRPAPSLFPRLNEAFANAPVSNPNGTTGITVINDYGQGGAFTGGNFISDADGIVDGLGLEYINYKAANFATNRIGYFHYVIMPHQYTDRNNFSSGLAYIIGSDMIVSLQCSNSDINVANTIMHELGHNLGLNHGGNDGVNYKPNYNSVMNYAYQFPGVDNNCTPPGDGVLDYSRNARITLNENALNENLGICGTTSWDWNFNGTLQSNVSYDINADGVFQTSMSDYNDWANLVYRMMFSGGSGGNAQSSSRIAVCNNPAPTP